MKSSFDTTNPIQETIRTLTALRDKYPALAVGSQKTDYADKGVFIFSRFDKTSHQELLIALNSNSSPVGTAFSSNSNNSAWLLQGGVGAATVSAGKTTVSIPAFGWSVYAANTAVPKSKKIGAVLQRVIADPFDSDQIEVDATATGSPFVDVTFKYRIGKGSWKSLGMDSAATYSQSAKESGLYRVYPLVATFPRKAVIQFESVAMDSYGVATTSAIKRFTTK